MSMSQMGIVAPNRGVHVAMTFLKPKIVVAATVWIKFKQFKTTTQFQSKPALRGKMPIIVARARQIIFILQICTIVAKVEVVAGPVISSII